MPRCTQERGWQLASALGSFDAGRLTGRCLRHNALVPISPGTLTPDAAAVLHASLYRPAAEPVTGDTIFYVVSSDHTPVAWLTHDATVVTPAAALTPYQHAHQQQAVAALTNLTRHAIVELATLRNLRDLRSPGEPDTSDAGTGVLIAAVTDPTLTWWTTITGDVAQSRQHLTNVVAGARGIGTGSGWAGEVLIVDTYGYGRYGRHPQLFDLAVLCAIERLAQAAEVAPAVIGDWLGRECAGTTGHPTFAQVVDAFTDSYVGLFPTRRAFADTELDRRGWAKALADAGIPAQLFRTENFVIELFQDAAFDVDLPDGRIAVFRRCGDTAADPVSGRSTSHPDARPDAQPAVRTEDPS